MMKEKLFTSKNSNILYISVFVIGVIFIILRVPTLLFIIYIGVSFFILNKFTNEYEESESKKIRSMSDNILYKAWLTATDNTYKEKILIEMGRRWLWEKYPEGDLYYKKKFDSE